MRPVGASGSTPSCTSTHPPVSTWYETAPTSRLAPHQRIEDRHPERAASRQLDVHRGGRAPEFVSVEWVGGRELLAPAPGELPPEPPRQAGGGRPRHCDPDQGRGVEPPARGPGEDVR